MKKIIKKIAVALLVLLGIVFIWMKFSNPKNHYEQAIHPPIKSQDIAFEEYRFHQDSLVKIERATGTLIQISPQTFVKKNGGEITDSILLKVRELHTADDIFRSGIPMSINKNRKNFLESAGMIELRAYSGGEELEIKNGKTIGIELASFKKGDNDNPKINAILIIKGTISDTDYDAYKSQFEEYERVQMEKERKQREFKGNRSKY